MSLDRLTALADSISEKTNSLSQHINESNVLISSILDLNGQITSADAEIDAMTELLNKNNVSINEFEKLHEKSFFLDSNIHLNDSFTNETTLANLAKEFDFLTEMFHHHNSRYLQRNLVQESPNPQNHHPQNSGNHQNHQENLHRLLPERKLKNILSISNLNLKPIRCRSTKIAKQKSRYRLLNAYTLNPVQESSRSVSNISHDTKQSHDHDSLMNDNQSQKSSFTYSSSISDIHDHDHPSSISDIHHHDHPSSIPDIHDIHDHHHYHDDDLHDDLGSPLNHLHPVEITQVDNDDSLSNSPNSPVLNDFENFHQFLRPSRIDLREAFPENISKPPPSKKLFHNPVESIVNKGNVSKPTVETIFSSTINGNQQNGVARSFKDHSREILHYLIPQDDSPSKPPPPTTPKRSNFKLFNLLNSPIGSPRGLPQEIPTRSRQGSIDTFGRSLTASFMNLVGKDKEPSGNDPGSPVKKIPNLRQSKKPRDPITIPNPLDSKRYPCDIKSKSVGHMNEGKRREKKSVFSDALAESLLF